LTFTFSLPPNRHRYGNSVPSEHSAHRRSLSGCSHETHRSHATEGGRENASCGRCFPNYFIGNLRKRDCHPIVAVPIQCWRKRMGIEPTAERKSPPATGFEVRGGHQRPVRLQILIFFCVGATSCGCPVSHVCCFGQAWGSAPTVTDISGSTPPRSESRWWRRLSVTGRR